MKNFFLILLLSFTFATSLFAQSKKEVSSMLDVFKQQGLMNESDYKKAKADLEKMDDKEFKNLLKQGKERMNDPKVLKELEKLNVK